MGVGYFASAKRKWLWQLIFIVCLLTAYSIYEGRAFFSLFCSWHFRDLEHGLAYTWDELCWMNKWIKTFNNSNFIVTFQYLRLFPDPNISVAPGKVPKLPISLTSHPNTNLEISDKLGTSHIWPSSILLPKTRTQLVWKHLIPFHTHGFCSLTRHNLLWQQPHKVFGTVLNTSQRHKIYFWVDLVTFFKVVSLLSSRF